MNGAPVANTAPLGRDERRPAAAARSGRIVSRAARRAVAAVGPRSAKLRQPIFRRRSGRERSGHRPPAMGVCNDPAPLLACAPNVAPVTLEAVISVESGGNPLALNVNGLSVQPPPARDVREAAQVADELYRARLQCRSRLDAGEQPQPGRARPDGAAGAGPLHQHPRRRNDPDR